MYKLEFNEDTVVYPSSNSFIPMSALSLIGGEDVLKRRDGFPYMVGEYCSNICIYPCFLN
jgi:hypothetical protein